jgi:hypothetical protein
MNTIAMDLLCSYRQALSYKRHLSFLPKRPKNSLQLNGAHPEGLLRVLNSTTGRHADIAINVAAIANIDVAIDITFLEHRTTKVGASEL